MMVVSLRCNLVFTCLLIIFIETLDSQLFDVEYAELYHDIYAVGSFRDGGVYYLFHVTSDKARLIMYGQTFLYSSFSYGNTINDIYVEKFRRSDEEIIGITICSQFSFNRFVKMYFCLLDGNWFPTTSEDKNSFVGGPLNLQMDMERWEVHPIIDARIIMRGNAAILYYIGNEQQDNRESTRSQLWADDGYFLISPIYNFEKISRLSGDLPSSLIAPITSFYQNLNENTMTITLDKTGNREYVLKVVHANTKCGQSRNIITDLPKIGVNAPNPVANRSQNIVIDIAEAYFQPSNMVLFCRFRRGGWTYYQHSILPIHEVNDMDIKVIDSDTRTVIHHNTDDEFITHIEVFFHRRTKMRYVVVNIKRLVEPGIDTLNIYEFKSGNTQHYVKVEPTNVRYVQEILCTIYNDSRA